MLNKTSLADRLREIASESDGAEDIGLLPNSQNLAADAAR